MLSVFTRLDSKEKIFAQLIKENQGILMKISRLYTHCVEDEQDLFQEITLQLWKSYDSFRGQSKISTWIYRVALNTAITLFRKAKKKPQTIDYPKHKWEFMAEENSSTQCQIELLYVVIKKLPKMERAIVLMYLDDIPYKDIANTLGITEVNARVKMNRLKKTLKKMIEEYE